MKNIIKLIEELNDEDLAVRLVLDIDMNCPDPALSKSGRLARASVEYVRHNDNHCPLFDRRGDQQLMAFAETAEEAIAKLDAICAIQPEKKETPDHSNGGPFSGDTDEEKGCTCSKVAGPHEGCGEFADDRDLPNFACPVHGIEKIAVDAFAQTWEAVANDIGEALTIGERREPNLTDRVEAVLDHVERYGDLDEAETIAYRALSPEKKTELARAAMRKYG